MSFTQPLSFTAAVILLGVIACDADTSDDTSPRVWSPDLQLGFTGCGGSRGP